MNRIALKCDEDVVQHCILHCHSYPSTVFDHSVFEIMKSSFRASVFLDLKVFIAVIKRKYENKENLSRGCNK